MLLDTEYTSAFTGAGSYSLVEQVTANSSEIGRLSSVRVYDFKVTTVDGSGNESIGVELTTDADGLGYYWEIDNLAAGCEQVLQVIAVPVGHGVILSRISRLTSVSPARSLPMIRVMVAPQAQRELASVQSERLHAPVV